MFGCAKEKRKKRRKEKKNRERKGKKRKEKRKGEGKRGEDKRQEEKRKEEKRKEKLSATSWPASATGNGCEGLFREEVAWPHAARMGEAEVVKQGSVWTQI